MPLEVVIGYTCELTRVGIRKSPGSDNIFKWRAPAIERCAVVVKSLPVACPLDCGGGCPLIAHVEDGKVVRITNNLNGDPHMAGCIKGLQMTRVLYAPDRLRKPLIRTGSRGSGEFREGGWDEALDHVARRLTEIKERYGVASIFRLGSAGTSTGALHETGNMARRFLALLGGYTDIVDGFSSAAGKYTTPFVLGTKSAGIDAGTLRSSKMIILWGANIAEARLEGALEANVREAKNRGVPVVFIDPRRTLTAKTLATEWIPVYPGTDSAMMMAILNILVTEEFVDSAFAEKYSHGFDELVDHALGRDDGVPKTPEWAEGICGTRAETLRNLARRYGRIHPTALIPGLSIQRTLGGEEAIRMSIALQVATGNLGVEGGSSGALTWGTLPTPRMGTLPALANPANASVTAYRWADAVLEGRKGGYPTDIKALYNVGGNYLSTAADTHKVIRAFKSVEFSVCHDFFLTPTAKYCDVVLPAAMFLERNDVVIADGGNHVMYSYKVADPPGEAKTDYGIFCLLAERLGFGNAFSEGRTEEEWLDKFIAESEITRVAEFKESGIYFGADQHRVALSAFKVDPKANPLKTPSGLVQIRSDAYAETGYPAIPTCRAATPDDAHPLRLISPKSRYRVHSENWNIPFFRERERHALWINPADAEPRGISDGDVVLIYNQIGKVRIPAMVTGDIMEGVVCLLEGAWPTFDEDGVETSGSPNVLASTEPTMPSRATRTHSIFVQVEKEG
jgi:anaerobic dimethyl sulfoxide reductase subunit A